MAESGDFTEAEEVPDFIGSDPGEEISPEFFATLNAATDADHEPLDWDQPSEEAVSVPQAQVEPDLPPLATFPDEHKEALSGLIWIGFLESKFDWAGHSFVIRTIYADDYLKIGLVCREYRDSMADSRAYAIATVAACIKLVDGRPLPVQPLGHDPDGMELFRLSFDYVRQNWMNWTIDKIYSEFLELESEAERAIIAMGKAHG